MITKEKAAGTLLAIFTVAVFALCCDLAHCATQTTRQNSLGVVISDDNPLMYIAGYLARGPDAITEIDGNLNMRIKPLGTAMLYDQSILFCGLPFDKFQGIREPFVLTYRRQASQNVKSLGCHDLVRVDSLMPRSDLQ